MRLKKEFHCSNEGNFRFEKEDVRAFKFDEYSIPPHEHDFYEVNIICSGKGLHHIESDTFEVRVGNVFVIPPNTVHAYTDTDDLSVYHIIIRKDFITSNYNETAKISGFSLLTEIEPYLRKNSSSENFLKLNDENLRFAVAVLEKISDNSDFDSPELLSFKRHTVWQLLYMFSKLLYEQIYNASPVYGRGYEPQITRALEYIHKNFSEKITIELLCRETYMSRSTFLRRFGNICGCTPMQYLADYRRKKAEELLKNSSSTKTEIAHMCGFYDLSHMEKALKHCSL